MTAHADDRVGVAEKMDKVIELRRHGLTFQAIGDQLGHSRQWVHELYERALVEIPAANVAALRTGMVGELAEVIRVAAEVMHSDHYAHSNGKVVIDPDTGKPLLDSAPKLDAGRTIIAAHARLAKLVGADAPSQVAMEGTMVTYAVIGMTTEEVQACVT